MCPGNPGIDSGRQEYARQAVNRQQSQRKEQPVPQILDPESSAKYFSETIHLFHYRLRYHLKWYSLQRVIFSFADALNA